MTRRRKLTPKERAAIVGDYQDGLKVEVIAVAHCVSRALVSQLRRAAGVPARTQWTRTVSHIEDKRAAWLRRQERVRSRMGRESHVRDDDARREANQESPAGGIK
jgi:hypothetical protein